MVSGFPWTQEAARYVVYATMLLTPQCHQCGAHLLGAIYDQFTAVELALIILLFINECFFFFLRREKFRYLESLGLVWSY